MIKIIERDGTIKELEKTDQYAIDTMRHTLSHVLAQSIKKFYPNAKLAIGPSVENGFYYDIDFGDDVLTEGDFEKLEAEMKNIIKENYKVERYTLPRAEAIKYFEDKGETYKVELVKDLPESEQVYFAKQGGFVDLCGGAHLCYTGLCKAFKITSLAGAYWRGDEKNKMLTRVYGTGFFTSEELQNYLTMLEEAKKRDHRKLGKELGLFLMDEAGPGFPFYLPNGTILRNTILDYWRVIHHRAGYDEILTPVILSRSLWEQSGHWDHYKENMYTTIIDGEDFAIKPMNCPGSILVYRSQPHSYRELPVRLSEPGLVHRHEKSGQLHGLMRVREFTQDDSHMFIGDFQIEKVITDRIKLIDDVYKQFGFEYTMELSTRPEDSMGTDEEWEQAEAGLKAALDAIGASYKLNPGDGAFYGPKIDFHLKDCIGRTWQCGTIQLDFQLPQRFNLEYIGSDGAPHRPIMIHSVCFGSVERFIGMLIEHYEGAFPLWLAPVQAVIIPISDKTLDYANKVAEKLLDEGFRVNVDDRAEKMGYKIREAQLKKIPYMLVVGPNEAAENKISVRSRKEGDIGAKGIDEVIKLMHEEIKSKK